jgi:copper transport protein
MRSLLRPARVLLLISAGILGTASALLAHGKLLHSDPAAGSHLAASPKTVRLDFNEAAELTFTRVSIVTGGGDTIALVGLRHPDTASRSVMADVPRVLPSGDLRIIWTMAGADGHPTHGEIQFSIVAASSPTRDTVRSRDSAMVGVPRAPNSTTPETGGFGVESPLYVLTRWLEFCALLTVIGVVVFRNVMLPRIRSRNAVSLENDATTHTVAIWGAGAALALAATAILRLAAQWAVMRAAGTPMRIAGGSDAFVGTTWGRAWILQLVVAVITAFLFRVAGSRRSDAGRSTTFWFLATATTLVLAFTPALSGHAASASRLAGSAILIDAAHVIGAGGWLGTLLLTLCVGMRVPTDSTSPELHAAELFNAFSPVALTFAGIAALTGVTSGWINLGSFAALFGSPYGKVLLIKLALLVFVAAAGAYNWLRARPSLYDGSGTTSIRRSASIEIGLGIAVLLVTAVLVAVPTPMSDSP